MNLMNRALIQLAHRSPRIAQAIVRGIATSWRMLPAVPVVWFGTLLPREDVAILNRRNVALIMGRTFKEALKPGVSGAVTDFGLMMSDWAHLLKRVTTPTRVWHGDADTYVPFSMGQVLSESISGARFMPIAGGGHFMVIDVLSEVLCDLVQADVGESTNPSLLKVPT
jgi:pimeloyl-ACP methyl ester carboxylesterase